MGFINKLKDFFYDEEEIEEEEIVVPKKRENVKPKIKLEKEIEEDKTDSDISERELFKSERTFNFPIDMEDEPDFMPVSRENRLNNTFEVKNSENKPKTRYQSSNTTSRGQTSPMYTSRQQEKKFKPTPIISPVYGILENKIDKAKSGSTVSKEPVKKIDYDTVREKAYGKTKIEAEEDKGLFFNLTDEKQSNDLDDIDVKITYNDVDFDSNDSDDDLEVDVPKIIRSKSKERNKVKEEDDEDKILSDSNEQDLFNLIDNMYSSEEEEED